MFDGPDTTTKTPREIAADVRRSNAHTAAEAVLASAKARREQIHAEIRRLNSDRGKFGGRNFDAEITALTADLESVGAGLQALRLKAIAGRAVHSAAVAEALESTITTAAERGHEAMAALMEAVETLEACNAELRASGGEPIPLPYTDLQVLAARLSRLAGK